MRTISVKIWYLKSASCTVTFCSACAVFVSLACTLAVAPTLLRAKPGKKRGFNFQSNVHSQMSLDFLPMVITIRVG